MSLSPQRRQEVIDALRRGTVPRSSLDAFAVGLDRFESALDEELRRVGSGGSVFKAVRGEYGCRVCLLYCAIRDTPGCCWYWMRWRPFNACGVMFATRV